MLIPRGPFLLVNRVLLLVFLPYTLSFAPQALQPIPVYEVAYGISYGREQPALVWIVLGLGVVTLLISGRYLGEDGPEEGCWRTFALGLMPLILTFFLSSSSLPVSDNIIIFSSIYALFSWFASSDRVSREGSGPRSVALQREPVALARWYLERAGVLSFVVFLCALPMHLFLLSVPWAEADLPSLLQRHPFPSGLLLALSVVAILASAWHADRAGQLGRQGTFLDRILLVLALSLPLAAGIASVSAGCFPVWPLALGAFARGVSGTRLALRHLPWGPWREEEPPAGW